MKTIIICSLSLFILVSAWASPEVPDPDAAGLGDGDRVEALLQRVQHEQRGVHSLEADFLMLRESEMLLEPEESAGRFSYAAPDRVRWEYRQPNPMTVVVRGGEMVTWYRDLGQAEIAQVGRHSERILQYMNASNSLAELLEYFHARVTFPDDRAEPYRLELTPASARVARRMSSVTLWIDRQRFLPVRVRLEAADGDLTEFRFDNLRLNTELTEDRFHLELPGDVEVRTIDLDSVSR